MQWQDYHLQWTRKDYDEIKVIRCGLQSSASIFQIHSCLRLPMEKIWRPDVILYNNADADQHYNSQLTSTNAIVTNEGNVTWLSSAIFKSSCEINVEYFPFDEQGPKTVNT